MLRLASHALLLAPAAAVLLWRLVLTATHPTLEALVFAAVGVAVIAVAIWVARRRGDHPASLPLSWASGAVALALASAPFQPEAVARRLLEFGGAIALSQLPPSLLALGLAFPSARRHFSRLARLTAALAVAAAWLAVRAVADPSGQPLRDLFGIALSSVALFFVAILWAAALPLEATRGELDRLRARVATVGLVPALVLGALGLTRVAPGMAALPAAALAPLALGLPLPIALALLQVSRFGVARRTRQALAFAIAVTLFVAAYATVGSVLASLEWRVDPRTLNVMFLFAAVAISAPLREAADRFLEQRLLRAPVDATIVLARADRELAFALDEEKVKSILARAVDELLDPEWLAISMPRARLGSSSANRLSVPSLPDERTGSPLEAPSGTALVVPLPGGDARPRAGSIFVGPSRSGEPHGHAGRRLVETLALQARGAITNAAAVREICDLNAELEERVRERTGELEHAQARLAHAEKLASLGQLVAGVAHEINNPLNFIQGNLPAVGEALDEIEATMREYYETLSANAARLGLSFDEGASENPSGDHAGSLDDEGPDGTWRRTRESLADIQRGARRVAEVVASLRTIAPSDANQLEAAPGGEPVDLQLIVENARTMLGPRVPPGVKVLPVQGTAPTVYGSASELERLFTNLIANSIDALAERGYGEVRLTLDCALVSPSPGRRAAGDSSCAEVLVDDDGPGVPLHLRPRLFSAYFTTKPAGKGLGLGLTICAGIVERCGGTIEYLDSPQGGARFRIRLPTERAPSSSSPSLMKTHTPLAVKAHPTSPVTDPGTSK